MARCKATDVDSTMSDCPPSYAHCQFDEGVIDAIANPTGLHAIPQARVHNVVNAVHSEKLIPSYCCSYFAGGAVAILLCLFVAISVFPYPLRASCTVQWRFDEPCTFVMQRLRCQIMKWTGCNGCGPRGNGCLYTLEETQSRDNFTIRATHMNPNLRIVDDIEIKFDDDGNDNCRATAKSYSRSWFTIFDDGTNYCNLKNLPRGAGFAIHPGFAEFTNVRVCTQLENAVCY